MSKSNIKNKAMVEITGFGLKGFEDNLSFFDKEYSANVEKMGVIDKPLNIISGNVVEMVQRHRYSGIYEKQHSDLTWFERNIYLDKGKESILRENRNKESDKYSTYITLGFIALNLAVKYVVPYFIEKNEKYNLTKSIYQLLTYIATIDDDVSESSQSIIARIMLDMPTSNSNKKEIKSLPVPTKINDIELTKSIYEFKSFVGWSLYRILINNGYSNERILNEKRHVFELIDICSHNDLKDFLNESKVDYVRFSVENNKFQNIISGLVDDVAESYSLSRNKRIETAMMLNLYDPYKENRELAARVLRKSGCIVKDVVIGAVAGGNIATVTAYAIAKNLFQDEVDDKVKEVLPSYYENILVKIGFERNEAIDLIGQGEKLHQSISMA